MTLSNAQPIFLSGPMLIGSMAEVRAYFQAECERRVHECTWHRGRRRSQPNRQSDRDHRVDRNPSRRVDRTAKQPVL